LLRHASVSSDSIIFQGGLSTGRTSTDNCDLRARLPEITILPAGVAPRQGAPATIGLTAVPDSQCHVETKFLTQFKFLGTHLVPKIDVQFGVTFQATPGPEIAANHTVLPAQTTPLVPLAGGFRLVNVVPPGTEYIRHIKQLAVRFSKIFRMGRTRAAVNFDLANALNSNFAQVVTSAFGARWLAPASIMDARLFKIGAQIDLAPQGLRVP
jgi:hypothetical protein